VTDDGLSMFAHALVAEGSIGYGLPMALFHISWW
jgi:hypothetical protein